MNPVENSTILVVDDTSENRKLLSRILVNAGYRVTAAKDGASAIELAGSLSPDLILLDIQMPELDGFATIAALKEQEETRDLPVIFISALDNLDDKISAFRSGGVDYILKPFDIEEVLARVKNHLSIHNLQVQLEQANLDLAERVAALSRSQKLLRERERKLKAFIDALPNLSFVYDGNGKYIEVLANEETLLAARAVDLLGRRIDETLPPEAAAVILSAIRQVILSGKTRVVEYRIPVLNGEERWFEAHLSLMESGPQSQARVVLVATDISERVSLYEKVQKLANLDPLTGCYNRRHFLHLAEQELERVQRYQRPLSLLMIDIDHFKAFNDRFGHQVGDEVLSTLVEVCQRNLRSVDLFGRYGGEEFIALLPETSLDDALRTGDRLQRRIRETRTAMPAGQLAITVSIGVSGFNTGDPCPDRIEILISQADQALYDAKAAGRDCLRPMRT
jgi:diguanylate cyclase (GGDEF)-like protein/PAS domain S-box-containing protein